MRRKTSERFACRSAEAAGKPEPERRRLERCRKVPGMLEKPGMPGMPPPAGVRRRDVGRSERHGDKRQDNKTIHNEYRKPLTVKHLR